jgi:hypothetical protein
MLGTVKNLGQGQAMRSSDHTFGTQRKREEWNAGKCINGEPNEKEV